MKTFCQSYMLKNAPKGFFENKEKRKKINDALQQNSLENIYVGGTFPTNFANASMILILSKN